MPEPLFIAKYIEIGCYIAAINISKQTSSITTACRKWDTNFKSIYEERCALILTILDMQESNAVAERLIELYNDANISGIYEVCCKSCQELCPEIYQQEKDMLDIRKSQKIMEKTSNLFKCPKCHTRKTKYVEQQRRALDEASGFQCTCENCHYEFYIH